MLQTESRAYRIHCYILDIAGEKENIHKTLLELLIQAHFFKKSYYITALYSWAANLHWVQDMLQPRCSDIQANTTFNIN